MTSEPNYNSFVTDEPVDTGLKGELIVRDAYFVPRGKDEKEVSFEQIDDANLGQEVYLVVAYMGEVDSMSVELNEKEPLLSTAPGPVQMSGGPLPVLQDGSETSTIELQDPEEERWLGWRKVAKIKLRPESDDQLKKWHKKLTSQDEEPKKSLLSIKVTAESPGPVFYRGITMGPEFFNAAGSWFEIGKRTDCLDTWDDVTNRRISELHPAVQCPAKNFINIVERELGIKLRVASGYRSFAEQTKLYNQGRTTEGQVVTNAEAGESYHNYGLAIDVVEIKDGEANWDVGMYKKIAPYGKAEGFEWGGDWESFTDFPHFQITGGKSTSELKKLYHANSNDYTKIEL